MGIEESWLAVRFVGSPQHLRRCLAIWESSPGQTACIRLAIDLIRIPDVPFVSWDRIPGGEFPEEPVPDLVPDLVVEVISRSNTRKEMDEKLQEYFEKGVRLVWFVRPKSRVVDVYTAVDRFTRLTASMTPGRRRRAAGFLGPGRGAVPEAHRAQEARRRQNGKKTAAAE